MPTNVKIIIVAVGSLIAGALLNYFINKRTNEKLLEDIEKIISIYIKKP